MTRERLRAATTTLGELGAPTDPRAVADAIVEGFATTLDLTFDLTVNVESRPRPAPQERGGVSTTRRE